MAARPLELLGRADQSSSNAALRRAEGMELDCESADRAMMKVMQCDVVVGHWPPLSRGLSRASAMHPKVNPTQSEALTMVCTQVIGNETTVAFAGSQGHLEPNVFKPVIANAALQSVRLLGDAAVSFADNAVAGIEPNRKRLSELMQRSLMLVTALAPKIGYDKAAAIAKAAHKKGTTLREEAIASGHVTAEEFDAIVRPETMLAPS